MVPSLVLGEQVVAHIFYPATTSLLVAQIILFLHRVVGQIQQAEHYTRFQCYAISLYQANKV